MNESFLLSLQGPVAHLQLNRPDRANTLAPAFFTALRDAVLGLEHGGVVRALVISATGGQFSAGSAADSGAAASGTAAPAPRSDRRNPNESAAREAVGAILNMLDDGARPGPTAARLPLHRQLDCLSVLDQAPFPTICAVQGGCDGAALALACACDIRVCSADASFTPNDQEPGGSADTAVLQVLARLLPHGAVRELAYTGARLGAAQARQLGFVNAVLPDTTALMHHALALASRVAARSPLAVAAAKHALRQGTAADWVALAPAEKV